MRQMATDLHMPLEVITCPTVRASDGLAMSSRHASLSPAERQAALVLWRTLRLAAVYIGKTRLIDHAVLRVGD